MLRTNFPTKQFSVSFVRRGKCRRMEHSPEKRLRWTFPRIMNLKSIIIIKEENKSLESKLSILGNFPGGCDSFPGGLRRRLQFQTAKWKVTCVINNINYTVFSGREFLTKGNGWMEWLGELLVYTFPRRIISVNTLLQMRWWIFYDFWVNIPDLLIPQRLRLHCPACPWTVAGAEIADVPHSQSYRSFSRNFHSYHSSPTKVLEWISHGRTRLGPFDINCPLRITSVELWSFRVALLGILVRLPPGEIDSFPLSRWKLWRRYISDFRAIPIRSFPNRIRFHIGSAAFDSL